MPMTLREDQYGHNVSTKQQNCLIGPLVFSLGPGLSYVLSVTCITEYVQNDCHGLL